MYAVDCEIFHKDSSSSFLNLRLTLIKIYGIIFIEKRKGNKFYEKDFWKNILDFTYYVSCMVWTFLYWSII